MPTVIMAKPTVSLTVPGPSLRPPAINAVISIFRIEILIRLNFTHRQVDFWIATFIRSTGIFGDRPQCAGYWFSRENCYQTIKLKTKPIPLAQKFSTFTAQFGTFDVNSCRVRRTCQRKICQKRNSSFF